MANRLAKETSPYLLQHAENPVDWYPWGEGAFEKAKAEKKPVLVSIGYAACHWCHVMEHESFEDPVVADFMNEHFINIKVDREEHPDVDHLYMDALQAMTGSGGWPLNMFVTPDRKPFYGGTYFPPKSVYGRSSWMELLAALHRAWYERPEEIRMQSDQMLQHLRQASLISLVPAQEYQVLWEEVDRLTAHLLRNADKDSGGFGAAPKFPATGSLQFLLEYSHFHKGRNPGQSEKAIEHAFLSLDKMTGGGIYDQIGGGFSRYATDNEWLVPHFEKMLYDNALMLSLLSNAYRLSGKEHYRQVITDTIAFCKGELRSEQSPGFYCALDADSGGVEGLFYTWTWAQWQETMGASHPALAAYFGVQETGNWEHTNILHVAVDESEICRTYNIEEEEWKAMLANAKQQLWRKRTARIRPATDDKMLLSWNALMNIALVDAALALEETAYLEDARVHMDWMLKIFAAPDGSWFHVFKGEEARIPAKLDDYAYLIKALCRLTSAVYDESYLTRAQGLLGYVQDHFRSGDKTFYYFSSDVQQDILVRKIELYDGATPSANAVMMENLWVMGNLMENGSWQEQSEAMLFAQKQTMIRYPSSFSCWAILLQRYSQGLKQLVICGNQAGQQKAAWHRLYHPAIYMIASDNASDTIPCMQDKHVPGKTLLYLCTQSHCNAPVSSVTAVVNQYLYPK